MDMQSAHILEARYQADDFAAKAHADLRTELLDAIQANPHATIVRTPGFGARRYTAAEVVCDQIDSDAKVTLSLLKMLNDAAFGENVQQRAADLLQSIAKTHADYHAEFMECDE